MLQRWDESELQEDIYTFPFASNRQKALGLRVHIKAVPTVCHLSAINCAQRSRKRWSCKPSSAKEAHTVYGREDVTILRIQLDMMAKLKRVVTFNEALAINLAAIIGAGVYVVSGLAAGIAGPSAIVAVLIGFFVTILTGLSLSELSYHYPEEGGSYEYSREVLGKFPGLVTGFVWITMSIIASAAMALSFSNSLLGVLPLGISPEMLSSILVIFLSVLVFFGVKDTAETAKYLGVINVSMLSFFILAGLFFIKPRNYVPFTPNGLSGLFIASFLFFFAFSGIGRVTALGEEVEDPKRTIPRSTMASVLIAGLLYLVVMSVLVGIVPYAGLERSGAPLSESILHATNNRYLFMFVSIGAVIATVNVTLSMMLGLSRVIFAMSRHDDLPETLKRLNKYGTPYLAVWLSVIIVICTLFLVSFRDIVSLSNAAVLFIYAISNLAAIRLYTRYKSPKRRYLKSRYALLVPLFGVFANIALLYFLNGFGLIMLSMVFLISTLYYLIKEK